MAVRQWTAEQKAQQAAMIQNWQPWRHSTGPRTYQGKRTSSRNAYAGNFRQRQRFGQWLLLKRYRAATLTLELTADIAMRSKQLGIELSANTQYSQFFAEMAINNVVAAMAIDCKNQLGFYQRACLINSAAEVVLGK